VETWLNRQVVQPFTLAFDNVPAEAREWRDKVILPILRQTLERSKFKEDK
jgi:hypothetical protein